MLRLEVGSEEWFDNNTNQFMQVNGTVLELEHSLFAISKWEQIWGVPFLTKNEKTTEEILSYVKCMITNDCSEEIVSKLTANDYGQIEEYMNRPMTAATFREEPIYKNSGEFITAETLYFMMSSFHIPFECQYWHLNRLLALLRMCIAKNTPPKKMTKKDVKSQNKSLNQLRRSRLSSKG